MKTNFRKFLAVISAAATAMSCITAPVFAEELQQSDTSVWNYDLIEEGSEQLYSDFPFSMHKLKGQEMNINICFLYLKNMSTDDIIDITVKDSNTNAVVLTKTLSADDHSFLIENPDMGKTFNISVNETLDGVTKQYSGYLETLFTEADFPVDMTLGDKVIENNAGETFSSVRYKKVGDSPVCQHENDEDCTEACNEISVVHTIQPSELNTFYNTLDSNCFYEMQVTAFKGTSSSNYYGYISTYNGGEDMGIFIPNFTFRKVRDRQEITQMSRPAPYATNVSGDDYFPNATEYRYFETVYLDYNDSLSYCFKFQAHETDNYVIETIGNLDLQLEIYTETNGTLNTRPSVVKSGGQGANPRTEYGWLVDPDEEYTAPILYIDVTLEENVRGIAGFKIIKLEEYKEQDDLRDHEPNFLDVVKANCDAGNFSPLDNSTTIDYRGDVDYFAYQGTAGNGYVKFTGNNNLYGEAYYVDGTDAAGFETLWYNMDFIPNLDPAYIECYNKRQYFKIMQTTTGLSNVPEGSTCSIHYNFSYYDPMRPDEYETEQRNNSPYYATNIANYPSDLDNEYILTKGTISRSDRDYYTFTTGNSSYNLSLRLDRYKAPYLYNLTLYDEDDLEYTDDTHTSWRWLSTLATGEEYIQNERYRIMLNDLKPNHKYYIYVTRPNNTSYDSYYPYKIYMNLTEVTYTATLSENIQLSHTVGNNITSTDSFKETVNSKLTCTKNGSAVSSSDALADLELYYNNEPLTASIVNSLTAGTYTIVPKYKNTAATGGTVTLTVTAPVTADITEITDIDNEPVILESMDWLAAAKIMANVRLRRENSTLNTTDLFQAAADLEWDDFDARGTAADTVRAATYFYTNGSSQTGNRFISSSVNSSTAENTLYNSINQGKSVAMLLTSTNGTTNMSLARYLVLFGVDKTNHRMKVMDPIDGGNAVWIDSDILFNGGYGGDSSLRFTGRIIEGI